MTETPGLENETLVTVARGDGIGPEIMDATLRVLDAAGAPLRYEEITVGERVYEQGHPSGIAPDAWEKIQRSRLLLKAPIGTPQGGGVKSLNVTLRKTLGLYANVRPVRALAPYVQTRHPDIDLVVVRENEEDLYAGIEYRTTQDTYQCLKLVTRPGTERIVRYAFEHARAHERQRVTLFHKANIMKLTDGLYVDVFDQVAADYPDLQADRQIIDIATARLADTPEAFDVIVTLNLYGDIVSDVAAQLAGSVGLAGSANVGDRAAMFEAVHGSAPDIAGRGIANPSGLLLAAVALLAHAGHTQHAELVHNAWLTALEDGVHTGDIAGERTVRRVGTDEFADAVVARLGERPARLEPVTYRQAPRMPRVDACAGQRANRTVDGIDVYVRHQGGVSALVDAAGRSGARLQGVSGRGVKVWPDAIADTATLDQLRLRLMFDHAHAPADGSIAAANVTLTLANAGLEIVKTELLASYDGQPGYSRDQGE